MLHSTPLFIGDCSWDNRHDDAEKTDEIQLFYDLVTTTVI